MKTSRRSAVDPFIVMDVVAAAARMEAAGRRVIHMEIGQPGTPAPGAARAAVAQHLQACAQGNGPPASGGGFDSNGDVVNHGLAAVRIDRTTAHVNARTRR